MAWGLYALKLGCISAYMIGRETFWLFAHQAATGLMALLLLWAALQFSRGLAWRRHYLWFPVITTAWALGSVYGIRDMRAAGIIVVLLLAAVTLWTGWVFWRRRRESRSPGATLLAWTFTLWGFHHLDYPLLRPLGSGVLYGVFADVLFIVAASIGTLFLVLGDERRAIEERSAQLEQLTRLLLRAQEDERRRIARELHDEAGQILTAVKIELDLDGRKEAGAMVGKALAQVRDLSNLLRPTVLDDLGLVPAVRGLVEDFAGRTRIRTDLGIAEGLKGFTREQEVVVYRVVQEALTNVARHAQATRVGVRIALEDGGVRLTIEDDGCGVSGPPQPHLGLLGMRERVTAAGGSLEVRSEPGRGFRIEAMIPVGAAA
jgi:signal transduction histidine kinase